MLNFVSLIDSLKEKLWLEKLKDLEYLFVCNLLKDFVSNLDCLASNNWKTADPELKVVRGKAVLVQLKALSS